MVAPANTPPFTTNGMMMPMSNEIMDSNAFSYGDPVLGLGMPFFDFEGTSLDLDNPMFSFPTA